MTDPVLGPAPAPTIKPWQSKTLFLNGLLGLLSFAALFWPNANFATEWINSNGVSVALIWSGVNVALRFVTKNAISLSD